MAGYQGYAGYGDPARAKVDRARQMAELLQQGATDTGPKSFWEGAAQLGKAFIARGANERADQAESTYADNRKRMADTLISTMYPDAKAQTANELAAPAAFDLTPGGMEQRTASGGISDKVKALAGYLGDPMQAIQIGQGMQAQQTADTRYADETKYARGRDAVGDNRWQIQFDYQGQRDKTGDAQWQAGFDQSGKQFDATHGLNVNQFGEVVRHNKATEGLTAAEIAAKNAADAAKAAGGAVFDGPQLATIYNKNMDALDSARTAQGDLDTIASTAQQFLDVVGDDNWIQGNNPISDLMQAGSFKTTELKALTDRIAPIMRKPGSGSSSDRDVEMFKNSVVNVNNTPEANKRFAEGAVAIADRNRKYIDFLNEMIDPADPQSRQKADRIWSLYKDDQRLFDDKTGALNRTAQPFDVWFAENAGGAAPAPAPAQDDVSDLLEKYR